MSNLPPLPKPHASHGRDLDSLHTLYTADQMREYSNQAVLAEREACANLCEDLYADLLEDADCRKHWPKQQYTNKLYAAAIRARNDK